MYVLLILYQLDLNIYIIYIIGDYIYIYKKNMYLSQGF